MTRLSATNLLASKREEITRKPTLFAIVDHKHAIADADWGGVTQSEPGISTARQLNLVAVACNLDCRNPTAMNATRILGCGSDQLGTVGDGNVLAVDEQQQVIKPVDVDFGSPGHVALSVLDDQFCVPCWLGDLECQSASRLLDAIRHC